MGCVAIETFYDGYHFRSRLEARWAVFFHHAGIKFQYEPEGFELNYSRYETDLREYERAWHTHPEPRMPLEEYKALYTPHIYGDKLDGFVGRYLPDFYLPEINGGMYVEVKGYPDPLAWVKCEALVDDSDRSILLVNTEPLLGLHDTRGGFNTDWYIFSAAGSDTHYTFCYCPCKYTIGCAFDGRGDRVACSLPGCSGKRSWHGDKGYSSNDSRLIAAAVAARRARFGT